MNKIQLFFIVVIAFTSCKSPIDKLLRSNDVDLKERKAQEYFENCDYVNASPLFKDLIQSLNSTSKIEKVYFYYSYCDYMLEDYLLAAYEFKKILKKFPRGEYSERAQFLLADCYYKSTPKFNLDQEYNLQAVQEFQIFIEKYPNSEKIELANSRIEELFKKREKKAYENAMLYYNMEDYRSSIHSFKQVLLDFPDTKKAEELRFLIVESAYLYAEKSIESKRAERYLELEKYAQEYLRLYANKSNSKYLEEVLRYQAKAKQKAKELEYSLPHYYLKRKQFDEAISLWENLISKEKVKEKKESIAESLLLANYEKVRTVDPAVRLEAVKNFLKAYTDYVGKLAQENIPYWKGKHTYYSESLDELPVKLAYEFLAAGLYKSAVEYFELIHDTISINHPNKNKHLYHLLLSKFKFSTKIEEQEAKVQLDEIIGISEKDQSWKESKYTGKIEHLLDEVRDELTTYPLILIENPMKRKDFVTAVARAERILDSKKAGKHQEDVVYLLLLSSLKKAKSVKKYERLPQYKLAKSKYDKYSGLVKDEKLQAKLNEVKLKIDKGLTKYLNKG